MFARTAALFALAIVTTAQAADWKQFRGPDGLGAADKAVPTTWSATENIAWKTPLPPGASCPVFHGNTIFITSYSGYNVPGEGKGSQENLKRHLHALNTADGKLLWTKDFAAKLPEQDRIRDDHGYASSTLAVDNDAIYAFFGKSGVFAFDHTGKQLWTADVGDKLNGWGSAASPLLHGNLVIINASVESDAMYAFDKKTGKEVWKVKGIRESWNTPVIAKTAAGKPELVVAIFGKVLGFDPGTGEQLWSSTTDIPWYMVPSIVSDKDVVYCIGGRNGGGSMAIRTGGKGDVTDSHRLWMTKKGANVPSPVFSNGHVFWFNESSLLATCTEAATGKIVYEERVQRGREVYASALLAGGHVYYLDRGGRTSVVAAKPDFQLVATNELGDRSTFNSSPVANDGKLYIRSDKFLYCIGK
jgi:outer membrane protein assembly factor BamB